MEVPNVSKSSSRDISSSYRAERLCLSDIKAKVLQEEGNGSLLVYCRRGAPENGGHSMPLQLHFNSSSLLFTEGGLSAGKVDALIFLERNFIKKIQSSELSDLDLAALTDSPESLKSVAGLPTERFLREPDGLEVVKQAVRSVMLSRVKPELRSSTADSMLAVRIDGEKNLHFLPIEDSDVNCWIDLQRFYDWFTLGEIITGSLRK